jgi:hypothetical protein
MAAFCFFVHKKLNGCLTFPGGCELADREPRQLIYIYSVHVVDFDYRRFDEGVEMGCCVDIDSGDYICRG